MKSYKDNVIVLNPHQESGNTFCRAKRKKKLGDSTTITTLCGDIVSGITEVHRPGLAIVTCTRCRALETGSRPASHYGVARGPRRH